MIHILLKWECRPCIVWWWILFVHFRQTQAEPRSRSREKPPHGSRMLWASFGHLDACRRVARPASISWIHWHWNNTSLHNNWIYIHNLTNKYRHVMILNALSNNNLHNYKRLCWHIFCHLLQIKSISIMLVCVWDVIVSVMIMKYSFVLFKL